MNRYQYFTERPHLLLGIILVIIILLFLAAAAAMIWDREAPPHDHRAPGSLETTDQAP